MKKLLTFFVSLVLVLSLSLTAFAMDFTPSAERKAAPETKTITGLDGEPHEAIFYKEDGTEAEYLEKIKDLELVLTSEIEVDGNTLGDIKDMIEEAKEEVEKAGSVRNLPSTGDVLEGELEVELQRQVEGSTNPAAQSLELDDFVVSDLFDISLVMNGEVLEKFPVGATVKFQLQTNFRPGDVFFVLVNCDGTGWTLVDSAVVDENGILTITASQLCVMAFVVPGYGEEPGPGPGPGPDDHGGSGSETQGRVSPQTGPAATMNWVLIAGGVCLVAAAGVVVGKKYKKRTEEN